MGTPEHHRVGSRPDYSKPSTTKVVDQPGRFVRITHPFHPSFGRRFRLVDYRRMWGDDRLYIEGDDGSMKRIPVQWTDHSPLDPFVEMARGRAHFRLEDLRRLADLLEGLGRKGRQKRVATR
jgi:hypothetical protein